MINLAKSIIGLGETIIKGKQRIKEAETNAKAKRMESEDGWEHMMAQASNNSWKDEYITILFSLPVILAFFPSMVPHVQAGFEVLKTMPEWFQIGWGVIISASFGIRAVNKLRIK